MWMRSIAVAVVVCLLFAVAACQKPASESAFPGPPLRRKPLRKALATAPAWRDTSINTWMRCLPMKPARPFSPKTLGLPKTACGCRSAMKGFGPAWLEREHINFIFPILRPNRLPLSAQPGKKPETRRRHSRCHRTSPEDTERADHRGGATRNTAGKQSVGSEPQACAVSRREH